MESRNILKDKKLVAYFFIILLAVVARILPHPPNFAPVGGLALFSGANFKKKFSIFIPILAMVISDLFLGFHATIPYVYISFILIWFIGRLLKNTKWYSIFAASLGSSLLFFLVTNFGVWQTGSLYPKTVQGLYQCYIMGIPFFRNTLSSDLLYSYSFFYGFKYLSAFLARKSSASV